MGECRCPRCLDPTELGAHMSSLICPECKDGVLPIDNSLHCEQCSCQSCSYKISTDDVERFTKECEAKMMEIYETEVDKYELLLKDYSIIFHQGHFQHGSILPYTRLRATAKLD